jgi:hypothetical protein
VGASSNLDASLSDQLFRVRLVRKSGLTLAFSSLDGIANLAGALDAEDSAVLRWWMRATQERPVQLLFEWRDRFIGVYAAPTSLERLVEHGPEWRPSSTADEPSESPAASAELAASIAAMQLGPPLVELQPVVASEPPPPALQLLPPASDELTPSTSLADAMTNALIDDDPEPSSDVFVPSPLHDCAPVMEALLSAPAEDTSPKAAEEVLLPPPLLLATDGAEVLVEAAPATPAAPAVQHEAASELPPEPKKEPEPEPVVRQKLRSAISTRKPPAVATRKPPAVAAQGSAPAGKAMTGEECAALIRELEAARGPKPLAVIERLFVSAYVPLSEAVASGSTDPRARAALEAWSSSFEKSYRDAFDALRLRGKRPTMVLDVPEVALRIGRLHGARTTQLVLVDGMRFDLGMRVQDRLREMLGQQAALTERLLLWSALPSTTATQLELIGRGPAGLRDMTTCPESEPPVARGRGACALRRVRAGNREVYKLDLVEARLAEAGAPLRERLEPLAIEVAEALAAHFARLPPRTLVMTFGDHGFLMDDREDGTALARHGGASPEEVLVPAFAWIVGPVH